MDRANPLAALKDIHLPEAPGFFPLAPGWYISLALVGLMIIFLVTFLRRKWIAGRPKREALHLLADLQTDFIRTGDSQQASAKTDQLLKRVALVYFPRTEVAGLYGEQWIDFLNKTSKKIDFSPEAPMLIEWPFQPNQQRDITPLFSKAKQWIQQRRTHA